MILVSDWFFFIRGCLVRNVCNWDIIVKYLGCWNMLFWIFVVFIFLVKFLSIVMVVLEYFLNKVLLIVIVNIVNLLLLWVMVSLDNVFFDYVVNLLGRGNWLSRVFVFIVFVLFFSIIYVLYVFVNFLFKVVLVICILWLVLNYFMGLLLICIWEMFYIDMLYINVNVINNLFL